MSSLCLPLSLSLSFWGLIYLPNVSVNFSTVAIELMNSCHRIHHSRIHAVFSFVPLLLVMAVCFDTLSLPLSLLHAPRNAQRNACSTGEHEHFSLPLKSSLNPKSVLNWRKTNFDWTRRNRRKTDRHAHDLTPVEEVDPEKMKMKPLIQSVLRNGGRRRSLDAWYFC